MIEVLGLFAALLTGLMAEGIFNGANNSDDDQPEEPDTDGFVLGESDGSAHSSDNPATPDPDQNLLGTAAPDNLYGEGGQDTIWGGEGDDLLGGRDGDDLISAGDGNDAVYGGAGNDSVTAGDGNDTIFAEAGDDVIAGEAGNDSIYAGPGDDLLGGGDGDDYLFGGEGADTLTGDHGADSLEGGLGNDILVGGDGADELFGGAGDDTIWGQSLGAEDSETDYLNGESGNDMLRLGQNDVGTGGDGDDVFVIQDYGVDFAQIVDFDTSTDELVIEYDPAANPAPAITVQSGGSGETLVLLDGTVVASLINGAALDAGQISLQAI